MHLRHISFFIGLFALILAGCNGQAANIQAPYSLGTETDLPAFLDAAEPRTREAYQFAIANHHDMKNYPCYCGCVYLGHDDLGDCYIQFTLPAGGIAFDAHAQYCTICVDISQDVMRLMREGKTKSEIRTTIDVLYSPLGPSTHTPLPGDET